MQHILYEGHERRTDKFYIEKYFNAFPMLLENISAPAYTTQELYAGICYSFSTFDRFLNFFGFVSFEQQRNMDAASSLFKLPHEK